MGSLPLYGGSFAQSYSVSMFAERKRGCSTQWPHIARYCDTIAAIPHIVRYFFREVSTPPKWCETPPWHLVSHRHICAIPHFATYRAIIVRYPTKVSTKEFCDTIAASIARYEKYRCWASKMQHQIASADVLASIRECFCQTVAGTVVSDLPAWGLAPSGVQILRRPATE